MAAISFKRSSLEDFNKYNSLLVGNAFTPPPVPSAYDLLETQVLASNASSVTFTGLGSYTDYKHLQIRGTGRTTRTTGTTSALFIRFNSDTGSNYAHHRLGGNGSTVASSAFTSTSSIFAAIFPQNNDSTNIFGGFVIDILDAFDTAKNTTTRSLHGSVANVTGISLWSGLYASTSAVDSIFLADADGTNFVAGSRFSLYGIKAA